ncbi:MAG: hypothetical protein ACO2O5_12800, partial [Candidatus Caldipriscus sp.]
MITLYLNLPNLEIKTFQNFVYPFVKNGFYPETRGEPFIPKVLLEIDISFPVEDISFTVIKADTISLSTYILPSPGFIPTDGREIDIPNFEYRG